MPTEPDDDWWRRAERRALRAHRRRRLGRVLLAPVRFVVRPRSPGVVVAVVAVALLAVVGWYQRDAVRDAFRPNRSTASPDVLADTAGDRPHDPFAGTPAASYAKGADGIVVPTAHATAGLTAAQVAADLTTVRTALVRGHLEHRMLVDHNATGLLALVAPDARAQVRRGVTAGYLGVRLAPGSTLATAPPRVRGSMTVRAGTDDRGRRLLVVTSNYVWVYAFAKAPHPVVRHDHIEWRFYPPGSDVADGSLGLWPGRSTYYTYGMDCAAADRNLLKPPPQVDPSADPVADDEDPDALYDPKHDMSISDTCR
ncbi:hypothetical protein [Actinocatenispora rupis]|uniref:Uncharacterized protein n=1 Tax=Actinocatenispora rupis TaxID=519421 RepID=A0A8J3J4C3_9ACTN|nr:hypothetical protein [Actinocatenispora rupis]GID09193.1 hypothetical protein Aru02nite_00820 [Actinocatenispora rupis]